MADVVARLVLAQVEEVRRRRRGTASGSPLQQPVEAADHLPLEAVEEPLGRLGAAQGAGGVHVVARGRGAAAGHALPERELGNGDGREDAVDDVVRRDAVGERLVREHEPVAQDVEGDLVEVLRQRVLAAAHERERPAGEDQVDRGARAGAEGDEAREVAEPDRGDVAGRVGELHRVLDQRRVDEHRVGRPLQPGAGCSASIARPAGSSAAVIRSTITNSSVGVG